MSEAIVDSSLLASPPPATANSTSTTTTTTTSTSTSTSTPSMPTHIPSSPPYGGGTDVEDDVDTEHAIEEFDDLADNIRMEESLDDWGFAEEVDFSAKLVAISQKRHHSHSTILIHDHNTRNKQPYHAAHKSIAHLPQVEQHSKVEDNAQTHTHSHTHTPTHTNHTHTTPSSDIASPHTHSIPSSSSSTASDSISSPVMTSPSMNPTQPTTLLQAHSFSHLDVDHSHGELDELDLPWDDEAIQESQFISYPTNHIQTNHLASPSHQTANQHASFHSELNSSSTHETATDSVSASTSSSAVVAAATTTTTITSSSTTLQTTTTTSHTASSLSSSSSFSSVPSSLSSTSSSSSVHHPGHRCASIDRDARQLGFNMAWLERLSLPLLRSEIHSFFLQLVQRYDHICNLMEANPILAYQQLYHGLERNFHLAKEEEVRKNFEHSMNIVAAQKNEIEAAMPEDMKQNALKQVEEAIIQMQYIVQQDMQSKSENKTNLPGKNSLANNNSNNAHNDSNSSTSSVNNSTIVSNNNTRNGSSSSTASTSDSPSTTTVQPPVTVPTSNTFLLSSPTESPVSSPIHQRSTPVTNHHSSNHVFFSSSSTVGLLSSPLLASPLPALNTTNHSSSAASASSSSSSNTLLPSSPSQPALRRISAPSSVSQWWPLCLQQRAQRLWSARDLLSHFRLGFDPSVHTHSPSYLLALPTTNSNAEGLRQLARIMQAFEALVSFEGGTFKMAARLSLCFQRLASTLFEKHGVEEPKWSQQHNQEDKK